MVAVLINGAAVLVGGLLGFLLKRVIKPTMSAGMLKAVGIIVMLIALEGVLSPLLGATDTTELMLLLVVTLVLGTAIGEALALEDHLNHVSAALEKKLFPSAAEGSFSRGFVTSTLVFCTGAMAIVGGIQASLGSPETYYVKSLIDGVSAIALASTLGLGVVASCVPLVLYQGLIVLLGSVLERVMPAGFTDGFAVVGYAMVLALGFNFLLPEEKKIKVVNMLPALVLVILYYAIFK